MAADQRAADERPRWKLYKLTYHLFWLPTTALGLVMPHTMAKFTTDWMHFCRVGLGAHVEPVNRRRYRLVVDRPERAPAPVPRRRTDG